MTSRRSGVLPRRVVPDLRRQPDVVTVHRAREVPIQSVDSLGLEWQTATPIPPYNFERIPVIMTDPYHYSEEGAPHWPIRAGHRLGRVLGRLQY